jgi:aldehyde dehydrogenase (NAD+)
MLPAERAAIIRRAAAIMEERREEIVDWLIRESGSTRIKANLEWQYAHAVTLEASTFPSRVEGPILPTDIPGKESRVYRQPVGVVGMISPWNFPFHLSSRSVSPALAVGNGVVIKPASDTPVTGGLLLAKIYEEAGLPPGVLNVVIAQGSVIGDAFVRHPVPRVLSFTGSTEIGRHIAGLAAQSPMLKRVVLELGGTRRALSSPMRTWTWRSILPSSGSFCTRGRSAWRSTAWWWTPRYTTPSSSASRSACVG